MSPATRRHQESVHPGTILLEHIVIPLHWSTSDAAILLDIDPQECASILEAQRPLSPELAQALECHGFGQADAWLLLQQEYDFACNPRSQTADEAKAA
ncbi:MAG: HigA family addiction module antitoxin [Corynebacterium sp.]|nr:HigA family addiction module antitoxin [Corynebacterium sp.]